VDEAGPPLHSGGLRASVLHTLAGVVNNQDDHQAAGELFAEAMAMFRDLGHGTT
jgi:hypothetical protein